MNKTLEIADKKIRTGLQELLNDFDQQYETMLKSHAAKGKLRSGITIKQTMNFISKTADSLRNLVNDVAIWAVREAIYAPPSFQQELSQISNKHFMSLHKDAKKHLQNAAIKSGKPSAFDNEIQKVEDNISQIYRNSILEIEAAVESNRSRGIKGIVKYLISLFLKLFGN